jgi:penicillin G amidase
MRRWLKRIGIAAGVLLLLLVLASAGGLLWLRTSLPQTEGTAPLPGLAADVSVIRDEHGIPTIRAASEADAYRALGYVHAQDRLWQMEQMRRLGAGRLSELTGSATLEYDRLMRTLGVYRLAERGVEQASPGLRQALESYAEGVNAWLEAHSGALPPEFVLLRHKPEPWRPADSLVWGKLMAMQLTGNWHAELKRAQLAPHFMPEQINLFWHADPDARRVPAAMAPLPPELAARALAALPPALTPRLASNIWALDGRHTASGKPLLANDPHLGLSNPSLWYLARIEAPGLLQAGATVPGVPMLLIGHNGRVAWGFTTTHGDTSDIFIEKIDPADPTRYLSPEGSLPFETREEVIAVRGGEDVTVTIRASRHGPIISDTHGGSRQALATYGKPEEFALSLSATLLAPEDRSAEALFRMNRAQSAADFHEALRDFHAPQQNIAFADIEGSIGMVTAGKVPIRLSGDGFLPVPGWTGDKDWTGFLPFEALPQHFNPPSGRVLNANNAVAGPDYPHFLGRDFDTPHRARRIAGQLNAQDKASMPAMTALQHDALDLAAPELLEVILPMVPDGPARRLLSGWDGLMDRNRPEPLLYHGWLRHLPRRLLADDFAPTGQEVPFLKNHQFAGMLRGDGGWCDDIATPDQKESCTDVGRAALDDAIAELSADHGRDMAKWRWGDVHRARFSGMVMGRIPLLGPLLDVVVETDGSNSTVNRGTSILSNDEAPYRHVHGAGLRAVFDLADLDASLFIQAPGQSANPFSPHYDDLAADWSEGRYLRLTPPQAAGMRELRLTPAP